MSSARRFAAILAESAIGSRDRVVDLAVSWRVCSVVREGGGRPRWSNDEEEILRVGGKWDRIERRWSGAADAVAVVRIVRGGGQERAARWFAEWLTRHSRGDWSGFRRVWSALLIGGRRGGKSHLAVAFLVTYSVLHPGSEVWAVSPALPETAELETAFRRMLPAEWYRYYGGGAGKASSFTLLHSSRILLLSGYKPSALRRGDVDVVLLNEGQNMAKSGYVQVRAPMADHGGLVVIAANPPDRPIGRWIEDHLEGIQGGAIAGIHFDFDPSLNPWVDFAALESMRAEVDEVTYDRDVLGLLRPVGDVVFHAWSDRESKRAVPSGFEDVTEEVTGRVLRCARPWIVGIDFQASPHHAAVILKLFRAPGSEDVLTWIVGEVVAEDTDEDGLLDAIESADRWTPAGYQEGAGFSAGECVVVMDASAWWQDGAHQKGRQSDRLLRSRGWTALYRPQADSLRNPEILERCKVGNARLKTADQVRHLFVAPQCLAVAQAIRRWENRAGVPHRRSEHAHLNDAWTYPVYRLFGRVRPKSEGRATFQRHATRREQLRGV